jgi:hypothetical protein
MNNFSDLQVHLMFKVSKIYSFLFSLSNMYLFNICIYIQLQFFDLEMLQESWMEFISLYQTTNKEKRKKGKKKTKMENNKLKCVSMDRKGDSMDVSPKTNVSMIQWCLFNLFQILINLHNLPLVYYYFWKKKNWVKIKFILFCINGVCSIFFKYF